MNISEESLRYLSELFNGDIGNYYPKKTGPNIFHFFNKYFGYHDSYTFGNQYPSRWNITYKKLVEIWNSNNFDKFLSTILSLQYLRTQYPEKTYDELEKISNDVLNSLNMVFENDENRIVKFADSYKLMKINDDEVLLGEGGYACCYYIKSKQIVEKRLKEENYLDEGVLHRFKREFAITKSLGDLNGIIKVFNYDEKKISYTMEKGEMDLYSFVKNNCLDEESKRKIIYQIAYIMNEVHKREIIHRDLSPTNIFLFSGQLKIADFGLGKDLNAFYSHQTFKTNSVGQYFYCDPRQFMKLKDGDKLSDIYSIGKIINFVMTSDPNKTAHKYYSVVEKATCDEKYRYKSVEEIIEGLKKLDLANQNLEFEEKFSKKIDSGNQLSEEDISFICSFDEFKMFKMIANMNFRIAFVRAAEEELIDEKMLFEKLKFLQDYCRNNRLTWTDFDNIGFFGSTILLSKLSYVAKEIAIEFINYPLTANRYAFIAMVKKEIIGNIEPSLEDKIDKTFLLS